MLILYVYVNRNYCDVCCTSFNKEGIIVLRLDKPQMSQLNSEFCKPLARSLFEPIKRFLEFTNKTKINFKTLWKFHINLFVKITMQEGVVNIHLIKGLVSMSSQGNNGTDTSHTNDKRKCFLVVNTKLLSVTLGHKPSLVAL